MARRPSTYSAWTSTTLPWTITGAMFTSSLNSIGRTTVAWAATGRSTNSARTAKLRILAVECTASPPRSCDDRLSCASARASRPELRPHRGEIRLHPGRMRGVGQYAQRLDRSLLRREVVLNQLGHDARARDEIHHRVGIHPHERLADRVGQRTHAVDDEDRKSVV